MNKSNAIALQVKTHKCLAWRTI